MDMAEVWQMWWANEAGKPLEVHHGLHLPRVDFDLPNGTSLPTAHDGWHSTSGVCPLAHGWM